MNLHDVLYGAKKQASATSNMATLNGLVAADFCVGFVMHCIKTNKQYIVDSNKKWALREGKIQQEKSIDFQEYMCSLKPAERDVVISFEDVEDKMPIKRGRGRPRNQPIKNKGNKKAFETEYTIFVRNTMYTLKHIQDARERLRICAQMWKEIQK